MSRVRPQPSRAESLVVLLSLLVGHPVTLLLVCSRFECKPTSIQTKADEISQQEEREATADDAR